jgi:hypothetical protein
MLAGEGAVAIWNGISEAGRAEFYAWHLHEHMPERVGIPGFLRGRRYRAADALTHPEFFTLYETQSFEVTSGNDYANRLNAPTTWTRSATSHFQTTSRALARVVASFGVGPGGVLLTVRFNISDEDADGVTTLEHRLMDIANQAEITGAHLLKADDEASVAKTNESEGRSDIEAPPRWVVLIEACSVAVLENIVEMITGAIHLESVLVGKYVHEHTRLKTAWAVG